MFYRTKNSKKNDLYIKIKILIQSILSGKSKLSDYYPYEIIGKVIENFTIFNFVELLTDGISLSNEFFLITILLAFLQCFGFIKIDSEIKLNSGFVDHISYRKSSKYFFR
jgi:hypothetical protein